MSTYGLRTLQSQIFRHKKCSQILIKLKNEFRIQKKEHVLWRHQGYSYTLWAREIGNFAYLVTYDGFSRGRVLSHLILNISSLDSPILEIKKLEHSRHIYLSNYICYSYIVEVFHLWVLHLGSCTQKLPIFTYKNNTIISQHAFDMFLSLQICI